MPAHLSGFVRGAPGIVRGLRGGKEDRAYETYRMNGPAWGPPQKEKKMSIRRRFAGVALLASLGLVVSACTGGSVSGRAAATAEEAFNSYIDALNAEDFSGALALVNQPGDLNADDIFFVYNEPLPAPILVSEPPADSADSAGLTFTIAGNGIGVDMLKQNGTWKLATPVLLQPISPSSSPQAWDLKAAPLRQIAEVAIKTSKGVELPAEGGVAVFDGGLSLGRTVQIEMTGKYGTPDQVLESNFGLLAVDPNLSLVDLGELPDTALRLVQDEALYKSFYATDDGAFVAQYQPATAIDSCEWWTEDPLVTRADAGFGFECEIVFDDLTLSGERAREYDWDSGGRRAVRDGTQCNLETYREKTKPTSAAARFKVIDGSLELLWTTPASFSEPEVPRRFTEQSIAASMKPCATHYTGVAAGDVQDGLAPSENESATHRVTTDLS